jgi:DNA-binding NarL/FixJ family response regulator
VAAYPAPTRSNQAIGQRRFLSPKTVEAYARSPFTKLGPDVGPNDNRRVLAVLAFLRS